MTNETTQKRPNFYLITPEYTIGTPESIGESARTIDIRFNDLADSYETQKTLRLVSSIFLRKQRNPYSEEERRDYTAEYLSAFRRETDGKPYLISNGLLRILITNKKTLAQLKQIKTRSDERSTKQNGNRL